MLAFESRNLLVKFSTFTKKNHVCTLNKRYQQSIENIVICRAINQLIVQDKNVNILVPDQFCDNYTIEFSIEKSKILQWKSFSLSPETMATKSPENLPALGTPPGTNNLFIKTHQYHTNQFWTSQWGISSIQKFDNDLLLHSLQSINLCGNQVINFRYFHNDLSISLSAAAKTNS